MVSRYSMLAGDSNLKRRIEGGTTIHFLPALSDDLCVPKPGLFDQMTELKGDRLLIYPTPIYCRQSKRV